MTSKGYTTFKGRYSIRYKSSNVNVTQWRLKPKGDYFQDRTTGAVLLTAAIEKLIAEAAIPGISIGIQVGYLAAKNKNKSIDFFEIKDTTIHSDYNFIGICADDPIKPPIRIDQKPALSPLIFSTGPTFVTGELINSMFKWRHIKAIAGASRDELIKEYPEAA